MGTIGVDQDAPLSLMPTVANVKTRQGCRQAAGRQSCNHHRWFPFVLAVPCLFIEAFQTSEDYYSLPLLPPLLGC